MNASAAGRERFQTVYAEAYDDVLRFVQRRHDPSTAEDVVAEAMVVAWRRADELPPDDGDARAWLFGIARNCLLNARRGRRRQDALGVRLAAAEPTGPAPTNEAELVISRVDLAAAWARLTPAEQDVLALTVLDGLTSPQAGALLGITPTAYRLRLSRARAALRRHLEGAASPDGTPDKEMTR